MSSVKTTSELSPNPKNPRTISAEKLDTLKASLKEFGDLGAIVFNRKTKRIVGGHQRVKALPKGCMITVLKVHKKPTKAGTVAEGFIEFAGESFKYREVSWDEQKEKAANLAANRGAGEWDLGTVSEWMQELDDFGFDTKLTLFDEGEIEDFLKVGTFEDAKPSKREKPSKEIDVKVECPDCGHKFLI